jgi:rhodanese-related sulfurtransferase
VWDIRIGVKQLVEDSRKEIEEIPAGEAIRLLDDDDIVFVDIRDAWELQRAGKIPGSFHAPRSTLEFWVDPDSPYFKDIFGEERKFIFYCAMGWRSALATLIVQKMGLKPIAHIDSGFSGWKKAGGPIERMKAPWLGWLARR